MCGLRLPYEKKKMGHGYTRTAGPPAHHVAMAMEELRSTIPAEDLTESIVKGKIMEIQGRKKVMGEKVKIETQMEEREPSPRPPTCDDRRRTGRSLPTTATSSQDVVAMNRAKAAPKTRDPRPPLGNPAGKTESEKEKDLEEAWLLLQDQQFKLSALKMKLEEEMRGQLSELRGVLGTLSWKASQTGPLYQSAASLKLSEIPARHDQDDPGACARGSSPGEAEDHFSCLAPALAADVHSSAGRCLAGQQTQQVLDDRVHGVLWAERDCRR